MVFNYASAGCANPATAPSTADSAQGMRLVAANGNSDFGLLEVIERIPPAYNVYVAALWRLSGRLLLSGGLLAISATESTVYSWQLLLRALCSH